MVVRHVMATLSLLLTVHTFISAAEVINKNIVRTVDASKAIVKVVLAIEAAGVDGEYQLSFSDTEASHLAHLTAVVGGKKQERALEISAPTTDGSTSYYTLTGFSNDANQNIKVTAIFTETLRPLPAQITQRENQYVVWEGSHYVLSPYTTVSQKTTVDLSSNDVESFTPLEPSNRRGDKIVFGPYSDVPLMSTSTAQVHFKNNNPFSKVLLSKREVEVSHWGNIAFEEIFELQHAGAKLKGGFSRLDYQMNHAPSSPSFSKVIGYLPKQANNIYYRDQIGNISTSELMHTKDKLRMDVSTRFPMFGGWKTEFYVGYSVPTESALFQIDEDTFKLRFNFFAFLKDVWIEDMQITVILPEGSTDVVANVPYAVEQGEPTRRFTYLDSDMNGGRPVLTFRLKNAVPQHSEQIEITYKFSKTRMIVEPAMLVGVFFFLFLAAITLSRVEGKFKSVESK